MGKDITQTEFSVGDYAAFRRALHRDLHVLQNTLRDPDFGRGEVSFGAELELYIIDELGEAKALNTELHEAMNDEQLTLELNRFNLEYNFAPVIGAGEPFSQLRKQLLGAVAKLDQLAHAHRARVLPIGILPTLRAEDMGAHAITPITRYHVLDRELRRRRGEDFHVHIDGYESLDLHWGDVSLEGANTSFQFHYRVAPADFANAYNAAQLVTPLLVALAANSPLFMGHELWHETRVALFKQSIDTRLDAALEKHLPARVMYGMGWVREGIHELFAEGAYLFEPLLPICGETDTDTASGDTGRGPELGALRLHQGSIWSWNRPIYDPADGGHLRIELRALPAGPSAHDMLANAALCSGLMRGLQDQMPQLLPAMPFRYAEQNFYRAAKHGLDARLIWPNPQRGQLEERSVSHILQCLLPAAVEGLHALNIADDEIHAQMQLVRQTLEARQNGALWQLRSYRRLKRHLPREEALRVLVEHYYQNSNMDLPVHQWRIID